MQLASWQLRSNSPKMSVTPFSPCSHHGIIVKFSGVITMVRSDVHAKGQGQRSKVKVTEVNTQLSHFRTLTPVWIHIWQWNHAHSWKQHRRGALLFFKVIRRISRSHGSKNPLIWPRLGVSGLWLKFEFTNGYKMMHKAWSSIEEVPYYFSRSYVILQGHTAKKIIDVDPIWVFPDSWLQLEFTDGYEMVHRAWSSIVEAPYCFSRSYVKFQGHTALKIVEYDPDWAFPDSNSSLNLPMAMKCCTKLETAKERCPISFQGHRSNFKVTWDKTSPILTQIGRFRIIGRSQLSNPSDLPCSRSSVKLQGHTALKIVEFDPNWAFPDCNSSLKSPMATKWCTKLEVA